MAERGMTTYAEVSRATGIFVTVVSRLAKGETKGIDFDTILRLCLGLRLTPNELFVIDAKPQEDDAPTESPMQCPKCSAPLQRLNTTDAFVCTSDETHIFLKDELAENEESAPSGD